MKGVLSRREVGMKWKNQFHVFLTLWRTRADSYS